MTFNWLFLTVVVILLAGLIFGLVKGFASTVYSLIATLLIIVLTIVLCPIVSNMLKQNENLYNSIYEKIDEFVDLEKAYDGLTKKNETTGEHPAADVSYTTETGKNSMMDDVLKNLGLPEALRSAVTDSEGFKDYVAASADDYARGRVTAMEPAVCTALTNAVLNAIGFLITFICVALVVFIIGKILDLVTKIPGLKQLDMLLGGAAGLFEALLVVWLLFTAVTALGSSEFGQSMLSLINENVFLSFLYENNLISAKLLGMLS